MTRRISVADGIAVLGIGIICLPVFLLLIPNIEMSRSEARLFMAYHEVRRLQQSLVNNDNSDSVTTVTGLDPWGQPYRVVSLDGYVLRVVSAGPDTSFSPTGIDEDDIYSDMPLSPFEAVVNRKRSRILIALGTALGLWGSLASAYLWRRSCTVRRRCMAGSSP